MYAIGEIIGAASIVSRFRSVLARVSSVRGRKQLFLVAPDTKIGSEENKWVRKRFSVVAPETASGENTMSHTDYFVAGNPLTSPRDLILLAQSELAQVRGRVAENPNCPVALLWWLAQDENAEVRLGVAYNPNVSPTLLDWLGDDKCPDVLFALAEDPNLDGTILKKLSRNDNVYVAERAKQTLKKLAKTSKIYWHETSESLAS
jgi:hypothetical protein